MKPPLSYVGGKSHLTELLLSLFPPHTTYVEVFGGAGHVILQKEKTGINVYNDINKEMVNLFKVLQDNNKAYKLLKLLYLTPYSRSYFYEIRDHIYIPPNLEEDLALAYRTMVLMKQSFASNVFNRKPSWGYEIQDHNLAAKWHRLPDKLYPFIEVLKQIQIENKDFRDLIKAYDYEDCLFYCDPPYYGKEFYYEGSFSEQDHIDLANILNNIKGKAIVTYYFFDQMEKLYPRNKWKYLTKKLSLRSEPLDVNTKHNYSLEYILMNYELTSNKLF